VEKYLKMAKMKKRKITVISRDHKKKGTKKTNKTTLFYAPIEFRHRWYSLIGLSDSKMNLIESSFVHRYIRKKVKLKRRLGRKARISFFSVRVKPFVKLTKKSSGIRMGSGKGSKVYATIFPIKKEFVLGTIRFVNRVRMGHYL
jgi:ribosomal protein L16/L10AE